MGNIVTVKLNSSNIVKQFIALSTFETEPYENRRQLALNMEVTKQELDNLFSTRQYERPYQPEYYNPLENLIGELYTTENESLAFKLVSDKIRQFIPRIKIDNANTRFSFSNYKIIMTLVFTDAYDYYKNLYSYERDFNVVT